MERRPLSSHPGLRILGVVVALGGFLALASVISPSSSTAMVGSTGGPSAPTLPSLGTLHGARYTIELHAGPDGEPLYTVTDDDGTVLASEIPADQLSQIDPDLDPEAWVAIPHAEVPIDDEF